MFGLSIQELLIVVVLIAVLSSTGMWPKIIRGLRELRGDPLPPEPKASSENMEIYYRLLGISPSAGWKEIEKAYRAKAKVHHPDVGGDKDAMRALNEAYTQIKKLRRE